MKGSIQISEVELKRCLLGDRLRGEQGLPLAIAMVLEGVYQMVQLRQEPATIRRMVEVAMMQANKSAIVMPTADDVAKLLGDVHDKKRDRGNG
jgi:hypothetical protein